eukprot:RCo037726
MESVDLCSSGMSDWLQRNSKQPSETSRWTEELVYRKVCELYGEANVDWVNRSEEAGRPYDIWVGSSQSDAAELFVEVKSTTSVTKHFFEISTAELDFLHGKGERYEIWRVYHAGTSHALVAILPNRGENSRKKRSDLPIYLKNPCRVLQMFLVMLQKCFLCCIAFTFLLLCE